ncbi:unnamed protein product [Meloidogyne enterolobii]|uniref:Uncharacterized protein n=2 Tax=Meloidogyne enterolobii TaxID=390850 RepID=A0ACB0ZZP6_MELEN|nr:unnamed protein product [Meloidogyne enterolobii]
MTRTCPFCNSSEIEEDAGRGDAICTGCGAVLEESNIISDVQFQERGGGQEVIGQFVSRDRAQPTCLGGINGLPRTESRETTFQRGRKRLQEVANQLRINQHCVELAFGFFKMCVTKKLTRGRLRSHVVVACLYMACRSENTSHLLLDFSDATQINIFDLGRTLGFLSRSLFIKLPPTDPCIYVLRFSAMLDFGDKQKEIALLATRIIQRMKRDWMSTGRRPTGICGAALLLASRAFNLNRSVADIVNIVHVSHGVVKRRLDEFANTPSGLLTIDEFNNVDLEESEDPPAFQESKKKMIEEEKRKRDEEKAADSAVNEFEPLRREFEVELQKRLKNSPYAKMIVGNIADQGVPELSKASCILRDEMMDTVFELAEEHSPSTSSYSEYGPTLESLGLKPSYSQQVERKINETIKSDSNNTEGDGNLDLTGIDDDEIDSYILTDTEASIKSKYWMARNSEHLQLMAEKRKIKEEAQNIKKEKTTTQPQRKKRKPNANSALKKEASDPNEAMLQVIKEKNLSNKINYEILKKIEEEF